jgi:hypothetical protein
VGPGLRLFAFGFGLVSDEISSDFDSESDEFLILDLKYLV